MWFSKTYSAVEENDQSPVKNFYHTLNTMKEDIYHAISPCEQMNLSKKEQAEFEKAQNCYVCAVKFSLNKENLKNRDHCHKTGFVPPYTVLILNICFRIYRGAACTNCNLKMRNHPEMNIYVHNLRGEKCCDGLCYNLFYRV